uniref:Zona pellucida protein AX 1 n=1 Tax=Neogobius melanostomus TaxID=47308 RepID=A0A8C6WPG1_9GOBI
MQGPDNMSISPTLMWTLLAAVILVCQARPNTQLDSKTGAGLRSECMGNLMRLSFDKALAVGNQLEVEAINGSQRVLLTPALAAQCGYSMESDPWGNTRIYTSLLGCYVHNTDTTFHVGLKLDMFNPTSPEIISHNVQKTCSYSRWAQREVLCDRNYMESSQRALVPALKCVSLQSSVKGDIWKLTFYTPEPITMVQREAEQAGYGAQTTAQRLVIRSPYQSPETSSEEVAGIPMEVLRVSVYYSAPAGLSVIDLSAACPIGGILFSPEAISWHMPRSLTPVVDSSARITELYLGMNGQRLDQSDLSARGYSLTTREFHIVVDIPVGAPDGYYKSHAPEQQYHVTFSVEPMLEVLWKASNGQETRYKVLFPITTPLMARPPQAYDQTVAESRVFSLLAGTFLQDVELKNITFLSGTFSVEECVKRGFKVLHQDHPNGTRSFSVQLGFDEDVVRRRNPEPLVTLYSLPLTLGFMILPELSPFSLSVELVASLYDVVHPSLSGDCDQEMFDITVAYGNQGSNFETFETRVGSRTLTAENAGQYYFRENATHFAFSVPYSALNTAFEMLTSDSVRARLDVLLWDPTNKWPVGDLSLICYFPLITIQCFPNGSVSAVALKLESVPKLQLDRLRLRDRSCRPLLTSERSVLFSFTVDSCGTSRKVNKCCTNKNYSPRQHVSCYYKVDRSVVVGVGLGPSSTPVAEVGNGQGAVHMTIATDSSYSWSYGPEDFPLPKFLQEPVFVEVSLLSSDPRLELLLQDCWATNSPDRSSVPRWDLIMDTCANPEDLYLTELLPVLSDVRGRLPAHIKRFVIKMFTFTQEEHMLSDQIHIHCDTVICNANDRTDGACKGQCSNAQKSWSQGREFKHECWINKLTHYLLSFTAINICQIEPSAMGKLGPKARPGKRLEMT